MIKAVTFDSGSEEIKIGNIDLFRLEKCSLSFNNFDFELMSQELKEEFENHTYKHVEFATNV